MCVCSMSVCVCVCVCLKTRHILDQLCPASVIHRQDSLLAASCPGAEMVASYWMLLLKELLEPEEGSTFDL